VSCGFKPQPSRVRYAGLRPPLTAAFLGSFPYAPYGTYLQWLMGQCWAPKLEGSGGHPPTLIPEMSNPHPQPSGEQSLELSVAALLTRARPLPPHDEMVIEDLTPDEGAEFLAALQA
jgi:hypothetical protein